MARDGRSKASNAGEQQEEMTVVILRFRGGGDTLRKGFDTVSQALAALGPAIPQHRMIAPKHEGRTGATEIDPDIDRDQLELPLDESDGEDEGSSPARPRKYSIPKFQHELSLSPAGEMAWKEYAESKAPQNILDKYLVAAAWLTKHAKLDSFSADQIFTCFRAREWEEQKDFSQPLRQLKFKKSYLSSPARGVWKLTDLGLETAEVLTARPTA